MVDISQTLQQQLSRYQIKERLGSGGMATVYRATDTNLSRDVAIKVMHPHLGHDDTFRERFEQEARFIASFNHPNIVQVYDFATIVTGDSELSYMVMPMLGADTLVDVLEACRLKGATLPHERIKDIINDLSDALDYAHARGMVHRDVKPANILFDDNKRAVLTDFGIARLADKSGLTAEGTIIGTPAYMSPEQATGAEVDYRSDIYALGIILFELLTGRPPFDDESTVSVLLKHAQTAPPLVSEYRNTMNPELDRVLQKVLEKSPNNRYQSARGLKLALEQAVNTESHDERFMPSEISDQGHSNYTGVDPTIVIDDELSAIPKPQPETNSITRTINTLVIKPAKQNPLGFLALAVGIIALLLIARVTQNQSTAIASPTPAIDVVDSMAGVDSMVGDAAFFTSDFEEDDNLNQYWQTTSTGSIDRNIENGVYRISNTAPSQAMTSLFDPTSFNYEDVNIKLIGRITEASDNPSSAVGIVFRYQDAENYNVFAIDGLGRYSIWRREDGQWCELRNACNDGDAEMNWQPVETVQLIGESNQLMLNVYQDQIVGYVNDEQVFMMDEAMFSDGAIGIYMATTQFGGTIVEVDSFAVASGVAPSAESMTDDG